MVLPGDDSEGDIKANPQNGAGRIETGEIHKYKAGGDTAPVRNPAGRYERGDFTHASLSPKAAEGEPHPPGLKRDCERNDDEAQKHCRGWRWNHLITVEEHVYCTDCHEDGRCGIEPGADRK